MQEGVAVLKLSPKLEFSSGKNAALEKRNSVPSAVQTKFISPYKNRFSLSEKGNANSNVKQLKKYDDKAIKTTKNFIGKSCYNVRDHSIVA